ncbi:MAG TPA: glycosyltransferase family 39 protein [Solirubrobacteraceae bacterium]|nr:glycosyltransferase family 39 protein [Solirubrobacteraceae bacterium]
MSSVAAPPEPGRVRPRGVAGHAGAVWSRVAERVRAHPVQATVAGVAALVLVSLWLRTRALDAGFWIDEGISVGIASFPFFDIPGVLKLDGSPPLFYLLLHLWMQLFGTSESATHSLSLVFALLSIPTAYWAGRSLFSARVGWAAAALAALNPFLTYYAQETRMYAMSATIGLVVAAAFLHLFVARDRRYLPVFVVALTVQLYSHNWAIFLGVGTVVALAALWRWAEATERRALLRDAVIAYGATGVLYLPWVPTLLYQAAHTGAPWAQTPDLQALLVAVGLLLGGATPAIALLLVAGNGLAGRVRTEADRRTAALIILTVAAALVAWGLSQISPAFANRYLAAFVGPLLLLVAVGLSNAGRLGLVTFVLILAFWFDARTGQIETKSNARSVGTSIQTLVTAGDLVVSTQPETLPLVKYYLPQGVRYANALGVDDPRVFDWTDALDRLNAAKPRATIDSLLRTLRPGQELVLVQPILRTANWRAPWTSLVRKRSIQWERRLDADPRVRREAVVPVFGYDRLPRGIRAIVYRVR